MKLNNTFYAENLAAWHTWLEQNYAASHTALPAQLYVSVGGLEGPPNAVTMTFVDTLKSRSYQDLYVTFEVLENETHSTALPRGYVNGIKTMIL